MNRLLIAPSAHRDLKEIHSYIADDNPAAADNLIERFYRRFVLLRDQPGIGRAHYDFIGLRSIAEGKYTIFYRKIGDSTIEIARVLHSARDIRKVLK